MHRRNFFQKSGKESKRHSVQSTVLCIINRIRELICQVRVRSNFFFPFLSSLTFMNRISRFLWGKDWISYWICIRIAFSNMTPPSRTYQDVRINWILVNVILSHVVWKSQEKSHSTLRAKRAKALSLHFEWTKVN